MIKRRQNLSVKSRTFQYTCTSDVKDYNRMFRQCHISVFIIHRTQYSLSVNTHQLPSFLFLYNYPIIWQSWTRQLSSLIFSSQSSSLLSEKPFLRAFAMRSLHLSRTSLPVEAIRADPSILGENNS